jgi:hypothetical protein
MIERPYLAEINHSWKRLFQFQSLRKAGEDYNPITSRNTSNQAMQRTGRRSDRSPLRNCSHKTVPFVQAAAEPKVAGSIET